MTVIGDIMGPSMSNLDTLLKMPYGCGEQNMLRFAPNIFIMNYLKNTNQASEEIKSKALNFMRSGKFVMVLIRQLIIMSINNLF